MAAVGARSAPNVIGPGAIGPGAIPQSAVIVRTEAIKR